MSDEAKDKDGGPGYVKPRQVNPKAIGIYYRAGKTRGGGRPTKLTPEVIKRIASALKAGAYPENAAAWAGVKPSTLRSWLYAAAQPGCKSKILREFSAALDKALSEAELSDIGVITRAAQSGDWKAAAWRLERRFPKRWGRRDASTVTVQGGSKPVGIAATGRVEFEVVPSRTRSEEPASPAAGGGEVSPAAGGRK